MENENGLSLSFHIPENGKIVTQLLHFLLSGKWKNRYTIVTFLTFWKMENLSHSGNWKDPAFWKMEH
jgi:hypothetical protein